MQKSRLIEVFSSLSKKDLRDLKKFVCSPFFNQRQDVIDLFDYLEQYMPFKNLDVVRKEVVYNAIFPKEKYDEKRICYTMSFLYKCIKDFLAYNEFTSDSVNNQLYLARATRKRRLVRAFEAEIKLAEKMLQQQNFRNIDYHYLNYQISVEHYEQSTSENRVDVDHFIDLNEELNYFFFGSKLRQICAGITHKTLSSTGMPQDFKEDILKQVENSNLLELPAIAIYYYSYKTLSSPNEEYFNKLRKLIKEHHHVFPSKEFKGILLLGINAAIRRINEGDRSYLRKLFVLYKDGLESGALMENGILSRFTYSNISRTGQGLKEY